MTWNRGPGSFGNPLVVGVTVFGDIASNNWDGGIPATLPDNTATQGYYLNANQGAIQAETIYANGGRIGSLYIAPGVGLAGDGIATSAPGTDRIIFQSNGIFFASASDDVYGFLANDTINPVGPGLRIVGGTSGLTGIEIPWSTAGLNVQYEGNVAWATGSTNVLRLQESNGNQRLTVARGGSITFKKSNGNDQLRINNTNDNLQFDDGGGGGFVEIAPRGRLITMGATGSNTTINNVSSSMTELGATRQTISCDYAGQEVFVKVSIFVTWSATSPATTYIINCGVNGNNFGNNSPLQFRYDATTSTAPNVSGTTGANAPNVSGTTGTSNTGNMSVSSSSGPASAGTAHSHTAGGYQVAAVESPHSHSSGSLSAASHSHGAGSLGAANHSHDPQPSRTQLSAAHVEATTANGSGNITVSVFAQGDGTADIFGWYIVWEVWAR